MAAITIRQHATATRLARIARLRAQPRDMAQRAIGYTAATVLICAASAALLQLVAQILTFPAPIAATAITLIGAALFTSLRRHLRTQARHR